MKKLLSYIKKLFTIEICFNRSQKNGVCYGEIGTWLNPEEMSGECLFCKFRTDFDSDEEYERWKKMGR